MSRARKKPLRTALQVTIVWIGMIEMTDSNQSEFPPPAPVVEQHTADVHARNVEEEGNQVTYTYPIRQPEGDCNDFQVGVRASILKQCRTRLQSIADERFPFAEILLGVSTLAAGGALSAIVSNVQIASWQGTLFFVLLPVVAVGSGVAYGVLCRIKKIETEHMAKDILQNLPDPDRAVDVRKK